MKANLSQEQQAAARVTKQGVQANFYTFCTSCSLRVVREHSEILPHLVGSEPGKRTERYCSRDMLSICVYGAVKLMLNPPDALLPK